MDRAAYPFESRWMSLRAGRMHYIDEGTGDPILFSHGTPTWSFEVELPGAGHWPHEEEPVRVGEAIRRFIADE